MLRLFDSHIHLQLMQSEAFWPDNTDWVLVPAVRPKEWARMLTSYADNSKVWLALGVHPQYAHEWDQYRAKQLRQLLGQPRVVAVGEAGLDAKVNADMDGQRWQQHVLEEQIELAVEMKKPLILHCYKRYDVLMRMLQQEVRCIVGGVVHGYSGSSELALQLWRLGFAIGIGRNILNPRARRLRATVTVLPDEAYVIETDAPWPAAALMHGDQGKTEAEGANSLMQIAIQVAELRRQSLQHVAAVTAANARRIMKL